MLDSVRSRLTLWYTGVLALVLVVLGAITYFIFWRSTVQRTDSDLAQLADAFLVTFQDEFKDQNSNGGIQAAARESILEHRFRDHVFAITDAEGHIVASSQDVPVANVPANPPNDELTARVLSSHSFQGFVERALRNDRIFQNLRGHRDGFRGFARHFSAGGSPYILLVLRSLHPQEETFEEIRETFGWVIPLALLLAMAGGYFLARKSLAPVVAMSTQAGQIGAANLHERLAIHNAKDELGHLALSFNGLLDRLDESFERQRRFMADASHELRTPVAILRGETEVALSQRVRSPEEYRESLTVLHHEAQRLTRVVEDLFTLARADAGQLPLAPSDFYLDELLTDCVHSVRTLALAKRIALTVDVPIEAPIHADEALLRRMILNLLDNAIKYTQEGGNVSASCHRNGNEYVVSITDSGPGIPTDLQSRIFERFFRGDKARSPSGSENHYTSGAGLGLSIARWISEAHQGRLELVSSSSSGSTFAASLPASGALIYSEAPSH